MSTVELFAQAIIAVLMITAPFDPAKLLLFNTVLARTGSNRIAAAGRVAMIVLVVLGGAALIGRELLDLFGINLSAFGFVGGLIVASMGFEMLYSGTTSKAQGKDAISEPDEDAAGFLMPLAIPLIAGPGAIATVITMASADESPISVISALVAVGVTALVTFLSKAFLGDLLARTSAQTAQLLQRIGGLLLATIGTQLALNGLRGFYGF